MLSHVWILMLAGALADDRTVVVWNAYTTPICCSVRNEEQIIGPREGVRVSVPQGGDVRVAAAGWTDGVTKHAWVSGTGFLVDVDSTVVFGAAVPPHDGKITNGTPINDIDPLRGILRERLKTLTVSSGSSRPVTWGDSLIGRVIDGNNITGGFVCVKNGARQWIVDPTGATFVWVNGGSYHRGIRTAAGNQSVEITRGYWMAMTELTVGQYACMLGQQVTPEIGNADRAKGGLSWETASHLAAIHSSIGASRTRYRLPTEAEWEYACRAGGNEVQGDLSKVAWAQKPNAKEPNVVATMRPNAIGMYDMHGNVSEWCQDWWARFPSGGVDPSGPASGVLRVLRGGEFDSPFELCQCSSRDAIAPNQSGAESGVRLILELESIATK